MACSGIKAYSSHPNHIHVDNKCKLIYFPNKSRLGQVKQWGQCPDLPPSLCQEWGDTQGLSSPLPPLKKEDEELTPLFIQSRTKVCLMVTKLFKAAASCWFIGAHGGFDLITGRRRRQRKRRRRRQRKWRRRRQGLSQLLCQVYNYSHKYMDRVGITTPPSAGAFPLLEVKSILGTAGIGSDLQLAWWMVRWFSKKNLLGQSRVTNDFH